MVPAFRSDHNINKMVRMEVEDRRAFLSDLVSMRLRMLESVTRVREMLRDGRIYMRP